MQLFFASYQGQVLAAAIVAFYNGWAIYLHGASSSQHREVMAPHLLHWRIMQEAKRRGFRYYDLWGVSPSPLPTPKLRQTGIPSPLEGRGGTEQWVYPPKPWRRWAGITRFKRGFAPQTPVTSYIGAWDLPLNTLWYRAYRWAEKIKGLIRR